MHSSKRAIALSALALMISSAAVVAADNDIYTGFGTTGFVLGYGRTLGDSWGARVEADAFHYSRDFSTSDVDYTGKLDFKTGGIFGDYFPASNGFRLTAGAFIGNNDVTGHGRPRNGTYTINGQTYAAAGQYLDFDADLPTVRPYLGVGYGHTPHNGGQAGFTFFADLGVAYGRPDVSLSASPELAAAAGQNIEEERNDLQDKADKLRFFPVVRVGVGYAF